MSKKNRQNNGQEEFKQADYYKLKTKAVDDLVSASPENSPLVSDAELRKYRSGPKLKIAEWVVFCFIKWWFPAAGCFFFMWGLGNYLQNGLDQMAVTAIAMGMVTDILTNNALRFFEKVPGSADRWIMCAKRKAYVTFPLNILYAAVLMFFVYMTYSVVNLVIIRIGNLTDTLPLAVEPIMFGLFWLGWDLAFVSIKNAVRRVLADAKKSGK